MDIKSRRIKQIWFKSGESVQIDHVVYNNINAQNHNITMEQEPGGIYVCMGNLHGIVPLHMVRYIEFYPKEPAKPKVPAA